MAKHLEVSLYRNARSFEAYTDMSTLKQRLHQIAAEVSSKARRSGGSGRDDVRHMSTSERSTASYSSQNGMNGGSTSPYMGNMSSGGNSGGRMVNMEEINPMSGGNQQGYRPQQGAPRNERMPQQHPAQSQRSSSQSQNRNDPEWKLRIRHKQQRLLLLHHSAKCPQKGQCSVTPHCADMKKLWRHMEGCKDNNCRVPHCFSSRAILSHYRKCKDPQCPACGPVRETVRKAQSSSRGPNPSTGPLMNSMRSSGGMGSSSQSSQPQQPQQSMVTPSASMGMGASSFGSSSMSHARNSHSGMPPPSGNDRQYSSSTSQYRPGSAGAGSTGSGPVQPLYHSEAQSKESRPQPSSSTSAVNDSLTASLPASARPAGSSESEWQKIRHKQQRLLLLRHASRCQHATGTCPVTPHCASMKKLWEHIAHCKNQQCKVQHCLSSRYVLSHYRRCKNPKCPSCGPVRDSIRRSTAREKRMQGQQPASSSSAMPSFDGADKFHAPNEDISHSSSSQVPPPAISSPPDQYQPERKRVKTEDSRTVTSGGDIKPDATGAPSGKEAVKPTGVPSKNVPTSRPSGDHSLLNSFTLKELETHLKSLDRKTQLPPAKLKAKLLEVLKGLQSHQHGWVFNCPVDPVELGLPDYFLIIKTPMDLGTVQKKLENGSIHEIKEFESLVKLTFDNAMMYNEDGSVVWGMAKELKTKFESDMEKLLKQLEDEDMERRKNERACMLCGCEKLLFEPPVYFCNGINCQSQRIRRNNNFYIAGNNQYFWCNQCYNELDDKIPIELVDMTIKKGDLVKKRNDEVHEESWVQCDTCERWVHQICGLFNTRQNKEHQSEYCCPACILDKRKGKPEKYYPKPPCAADLPKTALSEWLEKHITDKVEMKKRELAQNKAESEVSFEN